MWLLGFELWTFGRAVGCSYPLSHLSSPRFAFFKINLLFAVSIIGIVTFVLSLIGVKIGNQFGSKYENKAELMGGLILILIGFKILLEHLEIL